MTRTEERLSAALIARAERVRPDSLGPVSGLSDRRRTRWTSVAAVAGGALLAGGLILSSDPPAPVVPTTSASNGTVFAGVGLTLPDGWVLSAQPADPGFHQACLQPEGDPACSALHLFVATTPQASAGRSIRHEDVIPGLRECAPTNPNLLTVEHIAVDGRPAGVYTYRCRNDDAPTMAWLLDDRSLGLAVLDTRWSAHATSVVESLALPASWPAGPDGPVWGSAEPVPPEATRGQVPVLSSG